MSLCIENNNRCKYVMAKDVKPLINIFLFLFLCKLSTASLAIGYDISYLAHRLNYYIICKKRINIFKL